MLKENVVGCMLWHINVMVDLTDLLCSDTPGYTTLHTVYGFIRNAHNVESTSDIDWPKSAVASTGKPAARGQVFTNPRQC